MKTNLLSAFIGVPRRPKLSFVFRVRRASEPRPDVGASSAPLMAGSRAARWGRLRRYLQNPAESLSYRVRTRSAGRSACVTQRKPRVSCGGTGGAACPYRRNSQSPLQPSPEGPPGFSPPRNGPTVAIEAVSMPSCPPGHGEAKTRETCTPAGKPAKGHPGLKAAPRKGQTPGPPRRAKEDGRQWS